MSDGTETTSTETEPVASAATLEGGEPVAASEGDTSSEAPQTDEKEARLQRLEANLKGREQELARERESRQRMEQMLYQQQQQRQQPVAVPTETVAQSKRQLAERYQKALLDSDFDTMSAILQSMEDGASAKAQQAIGQALGQVAAMQQRQSALSNYLASRGLPNDPKDQFYKTVQQRVQDAMQDQRYAFCNGDIGVLTAVIVGEVDGDRREKIGSAKETRRSTASGEAFTESGSGGNGALPGKKPAPAKDEVWLTDEERKMVEYASRKDGIPFAEAARNRWNYMSATQRRISKENGKRV